MTLRDFYEEINSDYDEAMKRLMNEGIMKKFVLKFTTDSSYPRLLKAVEANNYEEAFESAHTLKGVCQNLGFHNLSEPASVLTDSLRNGNRPQNWNLMEVITTEYERTIAAIQRIDA